MKTKQKLFQNRNGRFLQFLPFPHPLPHICSGGKKMRKKRRGGDEGDEDEIGGKGGRGGKEGREGSQDIEFVVRVRGSG